MSKVVVGDSGSGDENLSALETVRKFQRSKAQQSYGQAIDPREVYELPSSRSVAYNPDNPLSYDVKKFYTKRSDDKGHEKNSQVWMPQKFHGLVGVLVADPSNPYRYFGDVLRDAVVHRVQWLMEHGGSEAMRKAAEQYCIEEDMMARYEEMKGWDGFLEATVKTLAEAAKHDALDLLVNSLQELIKWSEGKPDKLMARVSRIVDEYERYLPVIGE